MSLKFHRSRNLLCARCGRDTGNTNQGHFWAFCSVSRKKEEFHFCCPGNCALYGSGPETAVLDYRLDGG